MVPPPTTVALERSLCPCPVGLTSPLTSKNFDLVAQIQSVNSLFVLYEDTEKSGLRDYFQPTVQPTVYDALCDFRVDTVEVCGSSPHGPTILFSELASTTSLGKAPIGSTKEVVRDY